MNKEEVLNALKEVIDPELGENIVDLGLVRNIEIKDDKIVLTLILTTPLCPLPDLIEEMIKMKIREKFNKEAEIIISDEEWKIEYISEELKKKLGLV
ncbi:MAG: metal-sulfur cluster assembly factor [Candidatus Aenigmatarchaeota archaeon]